MPNEVVAIIAGGRNIKSKSCLKKAIRKSKFKIRRVVCGMAKGIDLRGKRWADIRGIDVEKMPADWDQWGRAAGHIRNAEMADYLVQFKPDCALILIWDGQSKGSANMLKESRKRGIKVFEYLCQ